MNKKFYFVCENKIFPFDGEFKSSDLTLTRESLESLYSKITIFLKDDFQYENKEVLKEKENIPVMKQDPIKTQTQPVQPPVVGSAFEVLSREEKQEEKPKDIVAKVPFSDRPFTSLQKSEMLRIKETMKITENEGLNVWVSKWSNNEHTDYKDLTPENINSFIEYMKNVLPKEKLNGQSK